MKTYLLLLPLLLVACKNHHGHATPRAAQPRPVSIEVEVYDPITNMVWENVSVRIVEADNEWSGCICVSPYVDWFETDITGRVFFDEFDIAYAEVGFLQDRVGGAILSPFLDEDQSTVLLEIDALGFTPVFVEVHLSWDQPDVFVEVPFN